MTPSPTTLQNLLTAVKQVADHQAELKRLKGEDFNLFSILGMETAEYKTHFQKIKLAHPCLQL